MTFFARRGTVVLGALTVAGLGLLVVLGLFVSPPDFQQGDAVRLMYLHVPAAWISYLAFGVTALASGLYLWKRTRHQAWDTLAGASAELGVLFTGLTLVLGSLWGRPVWNVWWAWDARVVSTAVLFFLYLGYLALRKVPADPGVRARRSAIAALAAFVDVPVVHFSVEWWRTLHQRATVFNPALNPTIEGKLAWALLSGVFAFTFLYLYLLERRYRLAVMEEQVEDRMLETAIAERRAEADPPTVGVPS
ncbi:MAG TPA: cytochrome c biogenesis protein CcsA [Acidimicrobiia bacterium]|jgi:heme exporter protein C|nr:cytochrome c biogenesis protein CcsA [Acidimicrobiia bacterium]